jgi:hypothetical protein
MKRDWFGLILWGGLGFMFLFTLTVLIINIVYDVSSCICKWEAIAMIIMLVSWFIGVWRY